MKTGKALRMNRKQFYVNYYNHILFFLLLEHFLNITPALFHIFIQTGKWVVFMNMVELRDKDAVSLKKLYIILPFSLAVDNYLFIKIK